MFHILISISESASYNKTNWTSSITHIITLHNNTMDEDENMTKCASILPQARDIISLAVVAYVLYNSPRRIENLHHNILNAARAFMFIQWLPFTLLFHEFFEFG